jgi:lysophospholipase L1-like esterase
MIKLAGKIIIALAISLIIWEVLLRIFVVVPIPYHHDPALGWMPKPYSSGLFTLEGRGYCTYNEFGFRGDTIGEKKPEELRVVALGDSYTEGQQLNIEQTFTAQLERLLSEKRKEEGAQSKLPPIRVLNGGRGGSSPAYSVQLAEEYKKVFQPDWVVLLINDGNWETIFDPSTEIYYRPTGDSFQVEVKWKWDNMSPLLKTLMRWHVRDLATFQYIYNRIGTIMAARAKATKSAGAASDAQASSARSIIQEKAIDWTLEQLGRLYPRLVVIHMPIGASTGGLAPLMETETLLIESCERHHIPLIRMRGILNEDYMRTKEPPFGFYNTLPWLGHPNAHGHELVARALYEFLIQELNKSNSGYKPQKRAELVALQ